MEKMKKYVDKLEGISVSEWKELKELMNKKLGLSSVERISVAKAAEIMGKDPQFIRLCLQRGLLPFGIATKTGDKNFNYYISPKLFKEYVGDYDKSCL